MRSIAVIVDASGSMLAGARAQIAGECLRVLLQEGIITWNDVYRWQGDAIILWPQAARQETAEWGISFGGSCNLPALVDFVKKQPEQCLVISDGYVFQDASTTEQHSMRHLKGRLQLLLLEQERTLAGLKHSFAAESMYAPEEIFILAEQLSCLEHATPTNLKELSFAVVSSTMKSKEEDVRN